VAFEIEEALRRFPLPDGLSDAVVNRAQLATALGVSENTITKYVTQGIPVITAGANGQSYEFQLSECYAWRMWRDDEVRAIKAAGDAAARQMAMLFRNSDDDDDDQPFMSARQIQEEADADYRRQRAAELRGELVRASKMRVLLEDILMEFRTSITTLVDYCEIEFGLKPDQTDKLQRRCDQALVQSRVRMSEELCAPAGEMAEFGGDRQETMI
jgi:phage terminase Nu1 subunit (DNA packaging protein)